MESFIDHLAEKHQKKIMLPSTGLADLFINNLFALLVPGSGDIKIISKAKLHREFLKNKEQLRNMLLLINNQLPKGVFDLLDDFYQDIPAIYADLIKDAKAIEQGDPAARNTDEVMLCYPGFYAIFVYRIANKLYRMGIPFIPRILSEIAHGKTGIDIHPGACIGESFFIDHGTGIVIGETCIIGNHVKIYQGVTLGALSVKKVLAEVKRHPTIDDQVVIYAGATILGGDTVIGKNSIIGGNVWLTASVEANSLVYHNADITIQKK